MWIIIPAELLRMFGDCTIAVPYAERVAEYDATH